LDKPLKDTPGSGFLQSGSEKLTVLLVVALDDSLKELVFIAKRRIQARYTDSHRFVQGGDRRTFVASAPKHFKRRIQGRI
jgi:hypothetical protein